ncbi:MAG: hypothetical protein IKI64_08540 [Clostridia bacterium]|nr:hypothetical protein [Clostridia bacterium]
MPDRAPTSGILYRALRPVSMRYPKLDPFFAKNPCFSPVRHKNQSKPEEAQRTKTQNK